MAAAGKVNRRAVFRGAEQSSGFKREEASLEHEACSSEYVTLWSDWSLPAIRKFMSLDIVQPKS